MMARWIRPTLPALWPILLTIAGAVPTEGADRLTSDHVARFGR